MLRGKPPLLTLAATAVRAGGWGGPVTPEWASTAPSSQGDPGKPTVFTAKTLPLGQTEISRSGDFCPLEADGLDVVPDENSLPGGEQGLDATQGRGPPDFPFLCH